MIKVISKFIFNFLNFFDFVLLKVTKRSFLIWFKDFYEKNSYKKIELNNKQELTFFTPNYLTNWLVDDFFIKEPETLEWIENFKKEEVVDCLRTLLDEKVIVQKQGKYSILKP